MNAVAPQVRHTRRIALLRPLTDLGESVGHALQLFDSMLWVFRGTTQSNWNLCSAGEADVIVLHRAEAAERMDEWRSKGKLIVILSADTSASTPSDHPADQTGDHGGDHLLVYPFRAAAVLSLLERLDRQLVGSSADSANVPARAPGKQGTSTALELVELIRTVREARNSGLWLTVVDGAQPLLWLRGDGAVYRSSAEVRSSVRCGALHVRELRTEPTANPTNQFSNLPGDEIAWFAGYYSSGSLAPWLDEAARYRLRRWPDFGALRAPDALTMACQLRVVAALDAQPATPAKLSVRARVTRLQTARTLNALAACGFIDVDSDAPAQRTEFASARPESGFKQLLRGLRKHLHLPGVS